MISRIGDAARVVADRWRWRKARTLADLADLQADRLARNLTNLAPDDDQHRQMMSALVALGRAGVVAVDWRPGTAVHGFEHDVETETRAAVSGFASTEVKDMIDNLLYRAGYESFGDDAVIEFTVMDLWGPGGDEDYKKFNGADSARWRGNLVERVDGVPTSWIGGSTDARQIYRAFPTRRSVQQELQAAWLITIADRKWGDSTLFAGLLQMLDAARQTATA
jgi:hypothetical protein